MALLDLCRRHALSVHAAHVNYQKRSTAKRDMDTVRAYCASWGIPFHGHYALLGKTGNFQAAARQERYLFFRELCEAHQCAGVLIAHQQDDVLETYLMQKQRGSLPQQYGIAADTCIQGVRVVRPLLEYSRRQLRDYCLREQVPFWDDESNAGDQYARNRIRHQIVAKLDEMKRQELLRELAIDQQALNKRRQQADAFLRHWDQRVSKLLAQADASFLLQHWLYEQGVRGITKQHAADLVRRMKEGKVQWQEPLNDTFQLYKEYERLRLGTIEACAYAYVYDRPCFVQTPYFQLCETGRVIEGMTLYPDDFPLTIRPPQPGDAIRLRFGRKKLHRWFIDRKIPQEQRRRWPVVVNAREEVIFVPKIGCDIAHFSNTPTLFMVQ